MPSSERRTRLKMFSITTILSSTTRPTATAIPPSVIILSEISSWFKKIADTNSDNGIDIIAMIVARKLRKKISTASDANNAPSNPSRTNVSTDFSMPSAESKPIA